MVENLSNMFGCVLVTGPRQAGKTTMLQKLAKVPYVTLDDIFLQEQANLHPNTFIQDFPPPIFIDEAQKSPNLFPFIKMEVDKKHDNGIFYLSGSQQFQMMQNVSESLAGRIGFLTLLGLSAREIQKINFTEPFLPTTQYVQSRKKHPMKFTQDELWTLIVTGGMPALHNSSNTDWRSFYTAYVKTYIERDVKDLTNVGNTVQFMKFMTATAAMTGQLLNINSLSRDVGISRKTAERWLSILVALNAVYLLQPYSNNHLNRAIKTPKLYFLDTGLACYLTKWHSTETLKAGAMSGAMFETFVVAEILKSYLNAGVLDAPLYFFRNKDMAEIDLIIEQNGVLHPIEIKKHADPTKNDIRNFRALEKLVESTSLKVGEGCLLCTYDKVMHLDEKNWCLPVWML